MTQEQQTLLSVLRHALSPNMPLPEAAQCDWEAVTREAHQQAVSLIYYDAVATLMPQMSPAVAQKILQIGMQVVAANINVGNAQVRLTALLQAQDVPHLILKGEASAAYYPKPQLRALGDVDFLVSVDDFARLHPVFQQLGYTFDDGQHDHHITYHAPGGVLEMHKALPGMPDGIPGQRLQTYLQEHFHRTETKNIGSGDFAAPDSELHGLILLLHSQHHLLSEGLGLRHLMDWCCYVNLTQNEDFWDFSLLPLLEEIGLLHFAQVLTGVCALAFGTSLPPWANAEEALCQALLEDILSGGNFGRKEDTRQASGLMISGDNRGKLRTLWKTFHQSVKAHHPICTRCKLLYIVFYPVRGVRYLWRMLTGKRESLIKAIPQANQRRDLYGQLQIFEVEENG